MYSRRLLVVALLAGCALLLPLFLPDSLLATARYDRDALADGEWWRLITAHVVHLNTRHALLNAAAAAVLVLLVGQALTLRAWLWILLTALLAVDVGLWFLEPNVSWYVGASGVLHGVIAGGALTLAIARDWRGAFLLVLLIAKLGYEHLTSGDIGFSGDLPVVLVAHLYGALGGAAGFLGAQVSQRESSVTKIS